jgi:hypothetical protein
LFSSLYYAFVGLIGGVISTLLMTLTEIPSWKKWGLHGVFEWHENEVITSRLFFSHFSNAKRNTNFRGIFFFHFLNGALAGIAFPYISIFLLHSLNALSLSLFGVVYGIVLWTVTLVPIHKPITGYSPWNHPLGHIPALASFSGHLVYGFALGLVVAMINQ